jgi:hypothetical protein
VAWLETRSETFVARHDERDAPDAPRVLAQLEHRRLRLEERLPVRLGELGVVLHGAQAQLDVAAPWVVVRRAMTAPAARRYVVGWPARTDLHVLAPRVLAQRASNVEGSLELLMLAPGELLARRTVLERRRRPRWLVEGAAQWLSGQTRHVRPAVARRLREGGPPGFPPGRADVPLLAGSVFELLEREAGAGACYAVILGEIGIDDAFHGRARRHTEAAWRSSLERLVSSPGRR